jgi:hypothetical protein
VRPGAGLTAAFVAHELRTQARSLRCRAFAVAYVAAGSLPAALVHLRKRDLDFAIGGATYALETMAFLPLLTALLAALLALDGIVREKEEGAWSTVSLAGVSSAGYLLRRWLALQPVLLPLTVVPLLAAAGIAAADLGAAAVADPGPFVWPWLLHVLPLALAASAFGLGAGTLAGGAGNAMLLGGAALYAVPALLDAALAAARIRLAPPAGWMDGPAFQLALRRIAVAFDPHGFWPAFPVPASESGLEPRVAAEQYLAQGALAAGLAAAALGLAVLYLRRTRPDVRPWRLRPDHPLRTFLVVLARLRERAVPDPAPERADRLAVALALLLAAGAVALLAGRARHYERLGRARLAAEEAGGPAPTAADVLPGRWRIAGRLDADGAVALAVDAELRNAGGEPRRHLAFALDPELRLTALAADRGRATVRRAWDRLAVDLEPPLPPGGRRVLSLHLEGRPSRLVLPLLGRFLYGEERPFAAVFRDHLGARFARDLSDLSRGYRVPALACRHVDLGAAALGPVPRYHPWTLTPGREVPEEALRPPADLELSLAVPPGLFLADACGGIARDGRLASRCRLPVADLAVAGGRYRVLAARPGAPVVAVLPAHAAQGEMHLGFLARGASLLDEAWPGLGDLGKVTVLEWPEDDAQDVAARYDAWSRYRGGPDLRARLAGSLVYLRERDLLSARPLKPEGLVAELVAARLGGRRRVAPAAAPLFSHLVRQLALQRLGLGPAAGALVGPLRTGTEKMVHVPPPERFYDSYWFDRFPAVVVALERRTGAQALRLAIDDFLSVPGERPGTARELFDRIAARSEAPVERLIADLFETGALPEPVLAEVRFQHAAEGWRAVGKVVNEGDGEALCKVVLTTDLAPVETVVRAGTGEAVAFALASRHRPQAVLLDPDQECQRLVRNGAPRDRVYFHGDGA